MLEMKGNYYKCRVAEDRAQGAATLATSCSCCHALDPGLDSVTEMQQVSRFLFVFAH